MPITNDNTRLVPRTEVDARVLAFDLAGVRVGVAEYDEGPTGCTVIAFDRMMTSTTDVRGGSPGTYMAGARGCDAICFSGGSLLGLEASAGVAAELYAMRGHMPGWEQIPVVQGGIIFDMGGPNTVYPDRELGRTALRAARPGLIPLGPHGAGRRATVGKTIDLARREPAGQGAAFARFGAAGVLVVTVVNALGAIVGRDGRVVRGNLAPDGTRPRVEDDVRRGLVVSPPRRNTTLTAVITERRLGARELDQLARQVHASMARAIQPFHTLADGDVLFAVTTDAVEDGGLSPVALGVLASELAWDAVLASFDPPA
jgi:L-aminopeptidase/D-esterase-like protein